MGHLGYLQISDYCANLLPDEKRREIECHLQQCVYCKKRLKATKRGLNILESTLSDCFVRPDTPAPQSEHLNNQPDLKDEDWYPSIAETDLKDQHMAAVGSFGGSGNETCLIRICNVYGDIEALAPSTARPVYIKVSNSIGLAVYVVDRGWARQLQTMEFSARIFRHGLWEENLDIVRKSCYNSTLIVTLEKRQIDPDLTWERELMYAEFRIMAKPAV